MRRSRRAFTSLVLLLAPAMLAAQPTREFGAATYTPPPGWQLTTNADIHSMSRVKGSDLCMIVVYADAALPGDAAAAFARAWTTAFTAASYASAPQPATAERTTPAGYAHLVGESDLVDRANNRYVARQHLFVLGDRAQAIILVGNSRSALGSCASEWDAFAAALRFPRFAGRRAAANAPAPDAAAPAPRAAGTATPMGARARATFETLDYLPPGGWIVDRGSAGVSLTPPDTQGGEALRVLLLAGRRSASSLREELETTWAEIRASLSAELVRTLSGGYFELDEPARSLAGWEYVHASGSMQVAGSPWTVRVYVIQAADRVERVAILARDFADGMLTTNASLNPRYARAIRELVFGLRFAGLPSVVETRASVRGGDASADVTGVWSGIAMAGGELKVHHAVFFSNGIAYFGPSFPLRGLLDIDPALEQPAARRHWGSYTFSGGSGVLTMPHGTIPLRAVGSNLELTTNRSPHKFFRLSMPDTATIAGSWCLSEGRCLRLSGRGTGRFEDAGAVRVLEHTTYAFPESPPKGSGLYELRDHTLVLRYDGGPEIRIAVPGMAAGAAATPRDLMLSFNLDVLTRQ